MSRVRTVPEGYRPSKDKRLIAPPYITRCGVAVADGTFQREADTLGQFLNERAPIGLYHRLLVRMLEDQASHRRGCGQHKAALVLAAAARLVVADLENLTGPPLEAAG